jgi:hypothetical protein
MSVSGIFREPEKVFLELSAEALSKALLAGVLLEVCVMSKIIESLRGDLAALQKAGAIGKVTMREFDAICPPPGAGVQRR